MDLISFFTHLSTILAIPAAFILLASAVYLSIILGFPQIRCLPRLINLIKNGIKEQRTKTNIKSINSFYALFTAMSTSLGIGTIVGPSIAIVTGGPGALFWMIIYQFFGAVTKFTEVTFGVHFRKNLPDGSILGGPMQYLMHVNPLWASWYTWATVFLFASWSSIQTNVLAEVLQQQGVEHWITGLFMAILTYIMLNGGAKRIGQFNTALVPVMFFLYVTFCLYILLTHIPELITAFQLMLSTIFAPAPAIGGFMGATIYTALRTGVYKGAYVSESGMGTAAIPHSLADVQKPSDQGVLAISSAYVETFLCLLSGLLVLISGVWTYGNITNIMMYVVFHQYLPTIGHLVLLFSIIMFAGGTIIGNSFNGRQSFAAITHYKFLQAYYIINSLIIFIGAIIDVPLVWALMDVVLPFVAVPNVLGLLYLAYKHKTVLK